VQGRTQSPDIPTISSKGTAVFSLTLLLVSASIAGIVGSVLVTARDGYRRQPRETFARTV
jgi:hypothetical protein